MSASAWRVPALVMLGALVPGCAPSLSTFQPAHVAPVGHGSASMGLEIGVPVGAFTDLVDSGKTLARRGQAGQPLSDTEKWQVLDAGVNLVLEGATIGPHFSGTYTPWRRLEMGLRYAGGAWRFGTRYQLLDRADGPLDLTVGIGLARFAYGLPLSSEIPVLKIDDFSRWQIDVPILAGTSRRYFRVWGGPKVMFTSFATQMTLTLRDSVTVARFEGTSWFFGAQGGVAFGYRWLFLGAELTLAEGIGTAHLTASGLMPPTHDTTIRGLTIFPSVGLMGEF